MRMKIVILWAGKGRRISKEYGGIHKALIPLNGIKLMEYLLHNIRMAGGQELVPVLGYQADVLLKEIRKFGFFQSVEPVYNKEFDKTNNLYSLLQASEVLENETFVVVNGDMIFDFRILKKIMEMPGNAIAVDTCDYGYQLDSPRILIEENMIRDIGRHRTIEESQGYAIGIYKFSKEFSKDYFRMGEKIVENHLDAGYHVPLEGILNQVRIVPCDTEGYLWMDIDEKQDVSKGERMILDIKENRRVHK